MRGAKGVVTLLFPSTIPSAFIVEHSLSGHLYFTTSFVVIVSHLFQCQGYTETNPVNDIRCPYSNIEALEARMQAKIFPTGTTREPIAMSSEYEQHKSSIFTRLRKAFGWYKVWIISSRPYIAQNRKTFSAIYSPTSKAYSKECTPSHIWEHLYPTLRG